VLIPAPKLTLKNPTETLPDAVATKLEGQKISPSLGNVKQY